MSTMSVSSLNDSRVLLLEQQVKRLSEDLVECQADKDFVWSLWKRLQVANPDLTQAVSLVVEREKQKAETKDRKVLEILQSKDFTLQELEQKVTGQQQEINNLVRRKMLVDEEKAEMKREQSGLLEKLASQGQELKDLREEMRRREEEDQRAVRAMEEEKEGLASRCVALHADLEDGRRQRDHARNRVKELERELSDAREEVLSLQRQTASMAAQLSVKETEVATKEGLLNQLQREVLEVQALYRQSTEHAAEQGHLIRQLEGLNLDTQRVLRNQEEAHTTDTSSHQQLYTEMSQCYQTLLSSEAKLRQSHKELSDQLVQKEQLIQQLQARLQQQQEELTQQQQQLQHQQEQHQAQEPMTVCLPPTRQTNFEELAAPAEAPILTSSPSCDPASVPVSGLIPEPQHQALDRDPRHASSKNPLTGKQQGAPVQRSRSLSPAGSAETGPGRRGGGRVGEERIQDLEELLQLKSEENEALRRAHEKRHERLRLIQTNYRAVRDQLREAEEEHGLPRVKSQRAEPWQLRHEDSDAVWNELTHFKRLSRKLNADKANLEEELDVVRVQAAMDRATVKEVRLCLQNQHQELLHKVAEGHQVSSSVPKKPCVSAERTEQSLRKMAVLEQRMTSLEEETERLREEKEELLEANEELACDHRHLQASLERLRGQGTAREEAARAEALAQAERHRGQTLALEAQLDTSQKEVARLHGQLLKLRQELGILRAARDFYRNRPAAAAAPGTARGGGAGTRGERAASGTISSKVKFKTARLRGPARQHSHPAVGPNQAISWRGRSPSPTKDEWEDMSADSDSGDEYSDSLNSSLSGRRPRQCYTRKKSCRYTAASNAREEADRTESGVPIQDEEQRDPGERGTRGEQAWCGGRKNGNRRKERRRQRRAAGCSSSSASSLRRRAEALQHHVDLLQGARRDSLLVTQELRQANQTITAQLTSLTTKLRGSKQLVQKLTCDLAGLEQQKRVLEMELDQWRQVRLPQPTPPPAVGTTESCSRDKAMPGPANPGPLQALEAEVKQLQTRLKSSSAEVTKQAAANKALRAQLLERDDKLRQLQDKVSHVERDATMKRQLLEDLKTRLKFFQETEKSYRGQVEELERKVKMLSEEAVNRKSLVDSLKRRLNVANTEKSQYEASCTKLKEDLDKKEQRVEALHARLGASERSMAELENTATRQMEGLAQQSSQALDTLHRQLGLAHSQLEQLHAFVKALASEMLRDVEEVKQQLMKRRRKLRKASSVAEKSGLSARSMIKAKSIAASILNMSESDLADMMDTDQEAEDSSEPSRDKVWLERLDHLLQQKIPSAGQLMEAVCVKMKERKVLTEELAALATPVSENA